MHKRMTQTKNGYQKMLSVYIKRREDLKKKHKEQLERMTVKILTINRSIKRIELRDDKISKIVEKVKEFMLVNLNGFSKSDKKEVLARLIVYRYCMEHGIEGNNVSEWFDMKDKTTSSRGRKRMVINDISNNENKKTYRKFLSYIKSNTI